MFRPALVLSATLCGAAFALGAQQPPPQVQTPVTNLGNDANGNPRRLAVKTGHISNYDETKVPPYTLPDPLVLAGGKRVNDANTWQRERRPEIDRKSTRLNSSH